jgi:hypothetical protein
VNRFSKQLMKWIGAKFSKDVLKIHYGQSQMPWNLYLKMLVPYFASDYNVRNFRRESSNGI